MDTWNQFKENTYCNSESYNRLYDASSIETLLAPIVTWADNTVIQPNLVFFSSFLQANLQTIPTPSNPPYNIGQQRNRRKLRVRTNAFIHQSKPYVIFEVIYNYVFDANSPTTIYIPGISYTIDGIYCRCIGKSPKNIGIHSKPHHLRSSTSPFMPPTTTLRNTSIAVRSMSVSTV